MQKPVFILLLLSACISASAQAEIYKSVDSEGNIIFSDKESFNSEEIPMRMPMSVPMPKPGEKKPVKEETVSATKYTSFRILQPTTNSTLRTNTGEISVSLELEPTLNVKAGHKIFILVNGKLVVKGATSLSSSISNISRGSHSINAQVRDANNKTLISSNKVIVHLKRQSALHNKSSGASEQGGDSPVNIQRPSMSGPVDQYGNLIRPGPQTPDYSPGPKSLDYRPGPINPDFSTGPKPTTSTNTP